MTTKQNFIHETKVYEIFKKANIAVPKFGVLNKQSSASDLNFSDGEDVVVKGIAKDLWHKSDEGALYFVNFSKEKILETNSLIQENLKSKYEWIETLVCQKIKMKSLFGLPTEAFLSINLDHTLGPVINFGLGGIHTENLALSMRQGIMMWPIAVTSPEDALKEFKEHFIGKVWLGKLRQGKALTTEKEVLNLLNGLWKIAGNIEQDGIEFLEVNPIALDDKGIPTILDGVGLCAKEKSKYIPITVEESKLLSPKKIAIAGVSEKAGSFGKKIFDNLLTSKVKKEDIILIKPGAEEFLGVKAYADISILKENPVDALILALPAAITIETIINLCNQGGGAEIVHVVAGGIGDGADKDHLGKKLTDHLQKLREEKKWTPKLIGPNCLGTVLSPLNLSTLFIAKERLPINFAPKGNIGIISQSGAFFITRFSNDPDLKVKYGFCIGNQMDLKVHHFVEAMITDPEIKVIGIYLEGLQEHSGKELALSALKAKEHGKKVVIYKGGRSEEGMKAAAGHTGAMAGNYDLQRTLFIKSSMIVTESLREYSNTLKLLSHYPNFKNSPTVTIISNAGFETVGSADYLGADKKRDRPNMLKKLSTQEIKDLDAVISSDGLSGLVCANNPLDLTPMASEKAYLSSAKVFAQGTSEIIVVCMVPLTEKVAAFDKEKVRSFALELKHLASHYKKSILMVVDSGDLYHDYKQTLIDEGLPVFSSIEEAFLPINAMPVE